MERKGNLYIGYDQLQDFRQAARPILKIAGWDYREELEQQSINTGQNDFIIFSRKNPDSEVLLKFCRLENGELQSELSRQDRRELSLDEHNAILKDLVTTLSQLPDSFLPRTDLPL